MDLNNKIAIVTGAASGFGEAIAKTYASKGARVAVLDLHLDKAQRVADEIGPMALAVKADVSIRADVETAVKIVCDTLVYRILW